MAHLTHWQQMARLALERASKLAPRERAFCADMARAQARPSDKQLTWLEALFERCRPELTA